jgi:phospholipid/cholesterol/gamma-HCH transport system substrate-binding protein
VSRRLLVNVAVFAVLGVALFAWAVVSVLSFDFVERPYEVTAEFDTSPGLLPAFQASYLGVPVGTIKSVDLVDGKVKVILKIDRDKKIPADVDAAVKRRSAVGEPYIDMTLPDGKAFDKDTARYLKDGDVIPLSRTRAPLEYSDLFNALDELVRTIPEDTLRTFIRELSVGLQGRDDSIRQIIAGTSGLTATVAANSELFEGVISETSRLVRTLLSHSGEIAASFDNLTAVAGALRDSRPALTTLLEKGPSFGEQVSKILVSTGAELGCLVDVLGAASTEIATPDMLADLKRMISRGPPFRDMLRDIVRPQPETNNNPWVNIRLLINGGSSQVPVYATERTLPDPPPLRTCQGTPLRPGGAGESAAAAAGAPPTPEGTAGTKDVEPGARPVAAPPEYPESSDKKIDTGGPDLGLRFILPLAVLIGLGAARPWRFLPWWRKGGG